MGNRREYDEFVAALARELGIELKPDTDGWVGIDCGLALEIAIGYSEATDGVVFFAPFRVLTPASVDVWARRALAFNLENLQKADGHFALDPDALCLIFQREIRITHLEVDELIDQVAAFLARFRDLSDRFAREAIAEEAAARREGAAMPPTLSNIVRP